MKRAVVGMFCVCCLLMLLGCGATAQQVPPNQPTALHVTLPPSPIPTPLYHPIDKTITDLAAVQKLYAAALALPTPLPGHTSCPAMIPDFSYHLIFLHGNTVLHNADLEATGCQALRFSSTDVRATNSAFLTRFQQTIGE